MILNHLLNSENEGGRALRIAHRCERHAESACNSSRYRSSHRGTIQGPFIGAYVNLHKVPMTGASLAGSLIMRNLTRFLWLGIASLMGKNIPKRNKTICYQTLRLNVE